MPTDTRSRRAIAHVDCPTCRAPIGEPCRYREDERQILGARLRSLPIHAERRRAYQLWRDAGPPNEDT